jgi:hypothetical protein
MRRHRSAEPAFYAEPNPGPDSENKKGPRKEGLFLFLVAGARYVNYMQIEIEPFPLVAGA